jgi:hypothetical protein
MTLFLMFCRLCLDLRRDHVVGVCTNRWNKKRVRVDTHKIWKKGGGHARGVHEGGEALVQDAWNVCGVGNAHICNGAVCIAI